MTATWHRFSPEFRDRAVRMVDKHGGDYLSKWAAMTGNASSDGTGGSRRCGGPARSFARRPRVLRWRSSIAPSSYQEHAARLAYPDRRPARARRDDEMRVQIKRVHEARWRCRNPACGRQRAAGQDPAPGRGRAGGRTAAQPHRQGAETRTARQLPSLLQQRAITTVRVVLENEWLGNEA